MDVTTIIHFVVEFAYIIGVFSVSLIWVIFIGRQSLINIICGIYIATLLFANFSFLNTLVKELQKPLIIAGVKIGIFVIMTILLTIIFKKLMPREYDENKFEGFGKKILLSLAFTIIFTAVSLTILPVSDFANPSTFLLETFADKDLFFWWLVIPLSILFFAG